MDTDHLEKQLPTWNRLMYMALSSAVILLVANFEALRWVAWFVLQILTTATGSYLLWGKNWKNLPLTKERLNIIFGCFLASWLLLFIPWIFNTEICFFIFPLAYTAFLLVIYWRTRKKLKDAEEMFP
jgi:hypothetical protein